MTTKLLAVCFALVLALTSLGTPAAQASHIRTGAYATTTANLNLRSGPSTGYYVKRVIPYGGRVWVSSGPYNSHWYKVTYSGTSGYVYGGYLRQGTTSSSSTSYSSKGAAIAATAKRYVGYRYTYGGESPSTGFDCSGFTQYVYKVNGIYIPRTVSGQAGSGWGVSRSSLRPGDILVFQNTVRPGLSHVGIYVGNGWMVDAGTPSTGVHYSYIYSSYWTSHWWGARRLVN